MPKEILDLWSWHCREEIDHKAVAFDVYMKVSGNRLRLFFYMVQVTILFLIEILFFTGILLAQDRILFKPKTWWQGAKFLFIKEKLAFKLLPLYMQFFHPRFHPWDHDNRDLLLKEEDAAQPDHKISA